MCGRVKIGNDMVAGEGDDKSWCCVLGYLSWFGIPI
jgi:hypothetical protein